MEVVISHVVRGKFHQKLLHVTVMIENMLVSPLRYARACTKLRSSGLEYDYCMVGEWSTMAENLQTAPKGLQHVLCMIDLSQ